MIDILIPTYNGADLLATCLDSLSNQTRQDFCITVIDDGSVDNTLPLLADRYPNVNVIVLPRNRGLTVALNIALRRTSAPYVVFLNNDTEAHPRWLERLIGALERFPAYAFAASKLLVWDRRELIHAVGDTYSPAGLPGNRGVWQTDRGQYDALAEVWGPCAGAAAYRRSALDQLSVAGTVLDEDLFMYCEDVDLNLRARLAGLRTLFVPDAIVYHRVSATAGGELASYYCGRNFIAVWVKNMPASHIVRFWPQFLFQQIVIAASAVRHIHGAAARARLRGQLRGLLDLPCFIDKRRFIPASNASFTSLLGEGKSS
ncbi:MAG: glycosyltransferase family 2 protein [Herpetosiphon sp.]